MLENLYVSFSGEKRRALGQGLKSNSLHHLFWIKPRSLKTKSESDLSRLFQRLIFQSKSNLCFKFHIMESLLSLLNDIYGNIDLFCDKGCAVGSIDLLCDRAIFNEIG